MCEENSPTAYDKEESGDEELSVLPRHTKVIVTGNYRTTEQGVVKKAVGLGGWHWLACGALLPGAIPEFELLFPFY
ncbi:hypothetical protein CsSME_00048423 [Camellia sinensis var. sinensis]